MRSRFLWKLYAGYALLILLTALLVGFLVAPRVERAAIQETDRRLKGEAALLREVAKSGLGMPLVLQRRVRTLGREVGTRLTVMTADGVVVADSDRDPATLDNHRNRPEIVAAGERGEGSSTRLSNTLGERMRYLAMPIREDDATLGFARASLPLDFINQRLHELRGSLLVAVLAASLVGLLLGFGLARRITEPLTSMTRAAEAIAAGSYEQRIELVAHDEHGQLARAFNTMSQKLSRQLETITLDRNKLEAILASMAEGVVAVDSKDRVVHINRVAADLLGSAPEAAAGKPIWEVTRIHEISEVLAETMRERQPAQRVARLPGRPDRELELHATPLRNGSGELQGAVLVLDDVTQLRRLETVRTDFVGNVSHELKTPVTVIRGMVETMLEDSEMEPTTRRSFLAKVQGQAERLSSLVTDLLSLSRLESEPAEDQRVDVGDVVRDTVRALLPASDAKRLRIVTDLPPEPMMVRAEEERLGVAVSNLLDNAIKFSPLGGTIEVSAKRVRHEAMIAVHDHGIGIEPRHQERIFERFYRVDKARSRELGGTGLGLAIVKHAALSFGGRVALESQLGEGSTFHIYLPLQSEDLWHAEIDRTARG
nr:sensor protein kinase WalK-like [Nerophis lumbriciformis]